MSLVLLGAQAKRLGAKGLSLGSWYLIKDSGRWLLDEVTTNKVTAQIKVASNPQPSALWSSFLLDRDLVGQQLLLRAGEQSVEKSGGTHFVPRGRFHCWLPCHFSLPPGEAGRLPVGTVWESCSFALLYHSERTPQTRSFSLTRSRTCSSPRALIWKHRFMPR